MASPPSVRSPAATEHPASAPLPEGSALREIFLSEVEPASWAALEDRLERLQALEDPGIVPTRILSRTESVVSLGRPFVEGIALSERLSRGPLSLGGALELVQSVLRILGALHDHGLLHLALKPSNVILGSDGRTVLVDALVGRPGLLHDATAARFPAMARYVSPEQAGTLHREVDGRADLYSFGVMFFECLAGHPPFDAPRLGDLLRQHLSVPAPSLRSRGVDVPAALEEILRRLLRKDPRERYPGAEPARRDLEALAEGLRRGNAEPDVAFGIHERREAPTEPALIGRRREIGLLEAELRAAREGRGGLVLLEADSGGGKTCLLREVADRASVRGFWILWGQGLDRTGQRPFQILAGLAQRLVSERDRDPQSTRALAERVGDHREAVADAFPELSPVLGTRGWGAVAPEQYGPGRTVRALSALLDALGTTDRPPPSC
jgi:two-component system sensor kinase